MHDVAVREAPVVVPHASIAGDVLRRLAEEFVSRDGTDYGPVERTLEEKVRDVRRRLERGEAAIVYDTESRTINIVPTSARHGHGATRAPSLQEENVMGDRSPKSKQRDQKQKAVSKATDAAAAKSKQDGQSRAPLSKPPGKG